MWLLPAVHKLASPHHSSRHGEEVLACVIHYTAGGPASGSISWLRNPLSKVSAHFVISRTGEITQLVSLDRAAWHAGTSELEIDGVTRSRCNRFTIGIELANHGHLQKCGDEFFYEIGGVLRPYYRETPVFATLEYDDGPTISGYWEPYPDEQVDALQELLLTLGQTKYRAAASYLVGHEEIALPAGRKKDPGPLFPWDRFLRRHRTRSLVV
jgi:N-acetylmuramoyl-L-alanine amidase